MRCRLKRRLGVIAAVALVASGAASCADSPTAPSAELAVETYTGTLAPRGLAFHTFTVDYAFAYTDASITVAKLTTVADGTEKPITVGVGFGSISVGTCTRAAALTNPAAAYNTELPTNGSPFLAGTYCVAIFDNIDAPTVTEPLAYTLVVKHY
jgi:hypothetical protein